MKTSEIISRVRKIAGDTDVLQFTDATVVEWINDAMRDIASDNQLLQVSANSNTVAGQQGYTVPGDILKLHSVRFDGEPIQGITFDDAKELGTNQGNPATFWVWSGKINLFPVPDRVANLEVNYTRSPTEVVVPAGGNDPIPEIPSSYHMRLVDYCLAQVAQQDDDLNRYNLKMEEFRTGVSKLKDHPEWENNLYPMISVSERDYGYGELYYD